MNPYTIITIACIWAIVLIISIATHQHAIHKKNTIEKNLTEHIDRLRHDAFIQHKDFDQTAKKRLLINQAGGYVKNRPTMQTDASSIWGEEVTKAINTQYKTYQKTSIYARISWTIANICSIGIYRLLA